MNLLITLPDEAYKLLQEKKDLSAAESIIANGKPYVVSTEDIQCPKDLNRYVLEHPYENTFPEKDCEMRKFYGDCYHCFASAIARRDNLIRSQTNGGDN